jgi:truncated hemoglobin YjbI
MRPIYAATFDLASGHLQDVIEVASEWLAGGTAPRDLLSHPAPGRRGMDLGATGQTLQVEVVEDQGDRLWQVEWRYPHRTESELHHIVRVSAGEIAGRTSVALSINVSGTQGALLPHASDPPRPAIVPSLLRRLPVLDVGERLMPSPRMLGSGQIDSLVRFLLDPARTRPVVYVAHTLWEAPPSSRPFDPDDLALATAGLAHVWFSMHPQPSMEFARYMGRLHCRDGARIYWPHLRPTDHPHRHNSYSQRFLDTAREPLPDFLTRWLCSLSAAAFSEPEQHRALRRRVLDARFRTHASPDWLDEYERTLSRLEEMDREVVYQRQVLAEVQRRTPGALAFLDTVAEAPPTTVAEAVQRAAGRCPHLVFLPDALESARRSAYRRPSDVLDELLVLQELAAHWAQPNGIGQSLTTAGAERGIDMRGRATRLGGTIGRQYERTWNGKRIHLDEHVRVGTGSSQYCARIYFCRHDPGDFAGRRFVIGHVGAHLDDSTT